MTDCPHSTDTPGAIATRDAFCPALRRLLQAAVIVAAAACAQIRADGDPTSAAVDTDPAFIGNTNGVAQPNQTGSASTTYTTPVPTVLASGVVGGATAASSWSPLLAADGNRALYMANAESDGTARGALVIYRSLDQGKSWTAGGRIAVASTQCAAALGVLPTTYNGNSNHRMVVAATNCASSGTTPCVTQLYTSDDGGNLWTLSGNATRPFATDFCSASFVTDDAGALHLFYSANGANNPNAILQNISIDGGSSWGSNLTVATVSVTPRFPSAVAIGASGSHRLTVVYEQTAFNPNALYKIGGVISSDNGKTWSSPATIVSPPADSQYAAPAITLADPLTLALTTQRSSPTTAGVHEVLLLFAAVPTSGAPVFGSGTALSEVDVFPPNIATISNGNIIVVTGYSSSTGPTLSRITLRRGA